jgi:hypothetical protein
MKLLIASLLMFSTVAMAELGQQDQPMCGEPCSICPSGIKECDKTQSSNNSRTPKSYELNQSQKAPRGKAKSTKQ